MAGASRPSISAVLCTHNARSESLQRAIASIAAQSLPSERYELIVVDNSSEPPLRDGVLRDFDRARLVREPVPGLTHARVAGIKASVGDLLVFVDDDNALAPDYFQTALDIAEREPSVGAFGGVSRLPAELPAPPRMQPLLPYLGVRDYGREPITSHAPHWGEWEPIGAGMVVRRNVAERFVRFVSEHDNAAGLGRRGDGLLSGEDSLMARCANMLGHACSYQPALQLEHHLDPRRLTRGFARRIIFGHGRSFVRLERLLGRTVEPVRRPRSYWLLLKRLLRRLRTEGRTGLVAWSWDRGYVRESRAAD